MTHRRIPELTFAIATEDEVMQMVDEGFRLAEHQDNLKVFQMGNRELITKAFLDGIQDETESDLTTIAFHTPNGEFVGGCLLCLDNPWYSATAVVISELATVSIKQGYGVSRAIAKLLSEILERGLADVAVAAAAYPVNSTIIANSYKKEGFNTYPTFFKER